MLVIYVTHRIGLRTTDYQSVHMYSALVLLRQSRFSNPSKGGTLGQA